MWLPYHIIVKIWLWSRVVYLSIFQKTFRSTIIMLKICSLFSVQHCHRCFLLHGILCHLLEFSEQYCYLPQVLPCSCMCASAAFYNCVWWNCGPVQCVTRALEVQLRWWSVDQNCGKLVSLDNYYLLIHGC